MSSSALSETESRSEAAGSMSRSASRSRNKAARWVPFAGLPCCSHRRALLLFRPSAVFRHWRPACVRLGHLGLHTDGAPPRARPLHICSLPHELSSSPMLVQKMGAVLRGRPGGGALGEEDGAVPSPRGVQKMGAAPRPGVVLEMEEEMGGFKAAGDRGGVGEGWCRQPGTETPARPPVAPACCCAAHCRL
jgi:hypothetical protein